MNTVIIFDVITRGRHLLCQLFSLSWAVLSALALKKCTEH
jgi:hypothetical protein